MSTRLKREAAKKHGLTVRAASCLVLMMINDRGERFDRAFAHLSDDEILGLMRFFPAPRPEVILDGDGEPEKALNVDWPSWIRDGIWECYCGEPRAIAADREGDEWRIWCECGALVVLGQDYWWLMEDVEDA